MALTIEHFIVRNLYFSVLLWRDARLYVFVTQTISEPIRIITAEERARLEHYAGDMTLSAYGRLRLLGDCVAPRQTRGKRPVKDRIALAKIFGLLKQTNLFYSIKQIAKAIHIGDAYFSEDTEELLRKACKALIEMRSLLMQALGLKP